VLSSLRQADFSAGMFRSLARHLIPENGCYDLVNLLLDEDGSAYKRGGTSFKSNAAFGSNLRWVWDGYLSPGRRTLFANADNFGVLAADDETPVDLGGAGLSTPCSGAVIGDLLFIDGGTIYAGSRKSADYSTGTVDVTLASATVTGTTTAWTANVDAGMLFRHGAERYYVVESVDSDTQITLTEPYQGATDTGEAYTLTRLGDASSSPYQDADFYLTAGQRLLCLTGDTVTFSNGLDADGLTQPHVYTADDQWRLPGGVQILGGRVVRDTAFIFTTDGVWSISNLALDLTDAAGNLQQRLDRVNADMILWGHSGVASWRGAMIVPATDDVYLFDGLSQPVSLSRSITPLLAEYVAAGYKPGGGTVFRNHYFLPILNSTAVPQDLLVCRLDRSSNSPVGAVYPWTRLAGHASDCCAFAVRVGAGTTARQPALFGASRETDAKVVTLTDVFNPLGLNKNDADGEPPEWRVITRDYQTGQGQNKNLVRRIRLRYGLEDAATDNPTIQAYIATGEPLDTGTFWGVADWGVDEWSDTTLGEFTLLSGSAEETLVDPYSWGPDAFTTGGSRTRFFRVRLQGTDASARAVVRSIELFIRPSGKEE
jgi:hypothetical protein